jgi:hypothetical protein
MSILKPGGSLIRLSGSVALAEPVFVSGTNRGRAIITMITSNSRGIAMMRNFFSLLRAMDMHRYIA